MLISGPHSMHSSAASPSGDAAGGVRSSSSSNSSKEEMSATFSLESGGLVELEEDCCIADCVAYLANCALMTPGIFRTPATMTLVRELHACYNASTIITYRESRRSLLETPATLSLSSDEKVEKAPSVSVPVSVSRLPCGRPNLSEVGSPHAIAGLLLYHLRENPSLLSSAYEEILNIAHAAVVKYDSGNGDENTAFSFASTRTRTHTRDSTLTRDSACSTRESDEESTDYFDDERRARGGGVVRATVEGIDTEDLHCIILSMPLKERRVLCTLISFLHSLCQGEEEKERTGGGSLAMSSPHGGRARSIPTNEALSPLSLANVFAPVLCRPKNTAYLSIRHRQGLQRTRMVVHLLIEKFPELEASMRSPMLPPRRKSSIPNHLCSAINPLDSPKPSVQMRPEVLRTPPPKASTILAFKSPKASPSTRANAEYHRRFLMTMKESFQGLFDGASSPANAKAWTSELVDAASGIQDQGDAPVVADIKVVENTSDVDEGKYSVSDEETTQEKINPAEDDLTASRDSAASSSAASLRASGESKTTEIESKEEVERWGTRRTPLPRDEQKDDHTSASARSSSTTLAAKTKSARPASAGSSRGFHAADEVLQSDLVSGKQRRKAVAVCKSIKAKLEEMEKNLGRSGRARRSSDEKKRAKSTRAQYRKVKRHIRNGAATQIQRLFRSRSKRIKVKSSKSSTLLTSGMIRQGRVGRRSTKDLLREKSALKKRLKKYDQDFKRAHGRRPRKDEKEPIRHLYEEYNALKIMLGARRSASNSGEDAKESSRSILGNRRLRSSSFDQGRESFANLDLQDVQELLREKRILQLQLRAFEKDFERKNGRKVKHPRDIRGKENEYRRYKELKEFVNRHSDGNAVAVSGRLNQSL